MQSDTYHGESTWNRVALGPIGGSSNPNLSSQARLFKSWVSYPFREAVEKLLHFSTQVTMSKSLRLHKHITWCSLNLCFGSNYYYFLLWLRKRIKSDNIHESTEPSHVLRQGSILVFLLPLSPASACIQWGTWSQSGQFWRIFSRHLCHLSFTFLLPIHQGLFLLMLVWTISWMAGGLSCPAGDTSWGEAVGLWASGAGRRKMRNKQMKHHGPGWTEHRGTGGWPAALTCAEPERWPWWLGGGNRGLDAGLRGGQTESKIIFEYISSLLCIYASCK